ncbi:MAG TPA: YbjN domain-containing protein, partial [Methylomirabilota bacterium]|nr:YbjN domain-containing protein [Methylomirabilota bacterium]
MTLIDVHTERPSNPVDSIELIAAQNDWSFERSGEDEITVSVQGNWCDYHVSFSWMEDIEALHLACAFDLKVPERRRAEVQQLISLINEQLWIGHFDLWNSEGVVMYRQALLLSGGAEPNSQQAERLLSTAIE